MTLLSRRFKRRLKKTFSRRGFRKLRKRKDVWAGLIASLILILITAAWLGYTQTKRTFNEAKRLEGWFWEELLTAAQGNTSLNPGTLPSEAIDPYYIGKYKRPTLYNPWQENNQKTTQSGSYQRTTKAAPETEQSPPEVILTPEAVGEIRNKVTLSDRLAVYRILTTRLKQEDIGYLQRISEGGITEDKKDQVKIFLMDKLTAEEIKNLKQIALKYVTK